MISRARPHDPATCGRFGCARCGDHLQGYQAALDDVRRWELGDHPADCRCPVCVTVRVVSRRFMSYQTGQRHHRRG